MDASWVAEKNREHLEQYKADIRALAEYIVSSLRLGKPFDPSYAAHVSQIFIANKLLEEEPSKVDYQALTMAADAFVSYNEQAQEDLDEELRERISGIYVFNPNKYGLYLDEEFELPAGDYLITDPCYLEHRWDYEKIRSGEQEEPAHFWDAAFSAAMPSLKQRSTIYGDWGCTLYALPRTDNGFASLDELSCEQQEDAAVGEFCADAGQVCIVRLDEAAAYNPDFVARLEEDFAAESGRCCYATVVRNFEGRGIFKVVEETYEHRGETRYDYAVRVVLDGHDTASGEPVRYESRQTSA